MTDNQRPTAALWLLIPFLFSGAAALMAQMCWLRSLAVSVGGSSAALNIVLITFMAGLAIGARLAPALCRRTRHYLLFYAGLEGLLSLYLLMSPWVITGLDVVFANWLPNLGHETLVAHMARLVVAGAALSLPTIAMGLTTPLLITAAVSRLRETASFTGLLYGTNTLGAAIGALAAGAFLILAVGVRQTLTLAAALNATAALLALVIVLLGRRQQLGTSTLPEAKPMSAREQRSLRPYFVLAMAGGFVGMALEVVFARFLVFMIGSSYYSHTISIAGFLTGIVLGSLVIGVAARWRTPRDRIVPLLFVLLGVTTLAAGLLFEALPMALQRNLVAGNPLELHPLVIKLVATLILVVLPAMASGLILPTLVHLLAQKTKNVTDASSGILFANTLGGVFGVALTGYLVIEAIGVPNTLFALVVFVFGLAFYAEWALRDPESSWTRPVLGLAAAGAIAGLAMIPLRGGIPLITHSVIYQNFKQPEILFYDEDEGASVSVLRAPGPSGRSLMVNGLTAAVLNPADLQWGASSDVALLSHPDPKTVFVAGTGSGKTSGVASLYGVDEIDSVEISRAAIDALPHFDALTYGLSTNEAVKVIHGDARHFLRTTEKVYDIILPDVFISALTGTSYLYNKEFFQLCAEHLAPEGRLVLNVYLETPVYRAIAQGVLSAFPYVDYIRLPYQNLSYLVASNSPIEYPETPWRNWPTGSAPHTRALRLGIGQGSSLASFRVADQDKLRDQLAGTRASTDDHPIVDYLSFKEDAQRALVW